MPNYTVSQGEHWYRNYTIEAPNLETAKAFYGLVISQDIGADFEDECSYVVGEPEYIEDIPEDRLWFEFGKIEEISE